MPQGIVDTSRARLAEDGRQNKVYVIEYPLSDLCDQDGLYVALINPGSMVNQTAPDDGQTGSCDLRCRFLNKSAFERCCLPEQNMRPPYPVRQCSCLRGIPKPEYLHVPALPLLMQSQYQHGHISIKICCVYAVLTKQSDRKSV